MKAKFVVLVSILTTFPVTWINIAHCQQVKSDLTGVYTARDLKVVLERGENGKYAAVLKTLGRSWGYPRRWDFESLVNKDGVFIGDATISGIPAGSKSIRDSVRILLRGDALQVELVQIRLQKNSTQNFVCQVSKLPELSDFSGYWMTKTEKLTLKRDAPRQYSGQMVSTNGRTQNVNARQLLDDTLLLKNEGQRGESDISIEDKKLVFASTIDFYPTNAAFEAPQVIVAALEAEEKKRLAAEKALLQEQQQMEVEAARPAPVFSNEIFDSSVKNLPKNFIGNDIGLLFQKMTDKAIAPKDEFETTAVYTSKINRVVAETMNLNGKWTDQSSFVTVWGASVPDWKTRYNADTETLRIQWDSIKIGGYCFRLYNPSIMLTTGDLDAATITLNGEVIERGVGEIKMSPAVAREAKPNLRILIVFRLLSTDSNPHAYANAVTIDGKVRELWLFNSQTGEVYKKLLEQK